MKVTTSLLIAVGLLATSGSALPTKANVASALEHQRERRWSSLSLSPSGKTMTDEPPPDDSEHKQERRWFYVGAYINSKADEPPPDSLEHQQERRFFFVSPASNTKTDEPPPDDSAWPSQE